MHLQLVGRDYRGSSYLLPLPCCPPQVPLKWAASELHAGSSTYQDAYGSMAESNEGKAHSDNMQMDKVGGGGGGGVTFPVMWSMWELGAAQQERSWPAAPRL